MAVIMSKLIPSGVGKLPKGKLLSDYAHGDIVKIKEADVLVEFYVAKHDYESGLNGAGRTLLVRKDCHSQMHNSNLGEYLNNHILGTGVEVSNSYKAMLAPPIQNAIGSTKIYYTPDSGGSVKTKSISVFLLSITELGKSHSSLNVEGSALPIASKLVPAYYNGNAVIQWTRSRIKSGTSNMGYVTTTGAAGYDSPSNKFGIRPAFTLPSKSTLFDSETNEFMRVVT